MKKTGTIVQGKVWSRMKGFKLFMGLLLGVVCSAGSALSLSAQTSADTVQVIVIIGQSNAAGWSGGYNGNGTGPEAGNTVGRGTTSVSVVDFYKTVRPNLKIYNPDGSGNKWVSHYWKNLNNDQTGLIGGGRDVGAPLAKQFIERFPDSKLYFIKHAQGGTSISEAPVGHWDVKERNANGLWKAFRDTKYNPAISALEAAGIPYEVKGVFWMQGETNAGTGAMGIGENQQMTVEQYQDYLQVLITKLKALKGIDANTKIMLGTISTLNIGGGASGGTPRYSRNVETAQLNVAAADPQVYIIDNEFRDEAKTVRSVINGTGNDGIHYNDDDFYAMGGKIVKQIYGEAPPVYVKAGVAGGDGSSWAKAYPTITAGLASGSRTLYVATGSYSENLTIPEGVTVSGGFLGTDPLETVETRAKPADADRWTFSNVTTITGALTVSGTLDGCTLTQAAVGTMSLRGKLQNCSTTNTQVLIEANNVVINGCKIVGVIRTNGNSNTGWGGCIYKANDVSYTTTIQNSWLTGGTAIIGGAVFYGDPNGALNDPANVLNMVNCVVSHNTTTTGINLAHTGGAVVGWGGNLNLQNCTIAKNIGTAGKGGSGGVSCGSSPPSGNLKMTNCIVWGGTGSETPVSSAGTLTVTYSAIAGQTIAGTGNINLTADPGFVQASVTAGADGSNETQNWRLTAGSSCINTGEAISSISDDLAGTLRPQDSFYDMGAYEFDGIFAGTAVLKTPTRLGGEIYTLTADDFTVSPAGYYTLSIEGTNTFGPLAGNYSCTVNLTPTPAGTAANYVSVRLTVPLTLTRALFVDANAEGEPGDGMTPGAPKHSLSEVLAAAQSGDFIKVAGSAEGIEYTGIADNSAFYIVGVNNVTLSGGWRSDFTECDPLKYRSILKNMNTPEIPNLTTLGARVLGIENADGVTVEGVTLTGGKYFYAGAGLKVEGNSSNVRIRNCIVKDNFATTYGGGINITGSGVRIENCTIFDNNAGISGGGIFISGGGVGAQIQNCTITRNKASGNGAGFALFEAADVINCIINYNETVGAATAPDQRDGCGIYVAGGKAAKITNCLIANNGSLEASGGFPWGAGICSQTNTARPIVTNCTIVNNRTPGQDARTAVQCLTLNNCILLGNTGAASAPQGYDCDGTNNYYSSWYTGGASQPSTAQVTGSYVLSDIFVNPSTASGPGDTTENANWTLKPGIPCLLAGSKVADARNSDILGLTWQDPARPDLGCYARRTYTADNLIPETGTGRLYITQSGSGSGEGSSWANAAQKTALSVALAKSGVTEIWAAGGNYALSETLSVPADKKLIGGFAGHETQLSERTKSGIAPWMFANATIFDGAGFTSGCVVDIAGTIEGVTIQNGHVGGVRLGTASSGAIVRQCKVLNNTSSGMAGAGIDIAINGISNFLIDECFVFGNTLGNNAGTWDMEGGGGLAVSSNQGAGNSYGTIQKSQFSKNKAQKGAGGLYLGRPTQEIKLINCLITNNESTDGATLASAIAFHTSTPINQIKVMNCTIVHNSAPGDKPAVAGNTQMHNSVVWGNSVQTGTLGNQSNNAIQGAGTVNLGNEGNRYFVAPLGAAGCDGYNANSDWRLVGGSLCIDTGLEAGAPETDLNGTIRPQYAGSGYDIGAYEYLYPVFEKIERLSAESTDGIVPLVLRLTLSSPNATGAALPVPVIFSTDALDPAMSYLLNKPDSIVIPAGATFVEHTIPFMTTPNAGDVGVLTVTVQTASKFVYADQPKSASVRIMSDPNAPNSENGYYLITSDTELSWFATRVNEGASLLKGKIAADFDIAAATNLPIGKADAPFAGEFLGKTKPDGSNYTVTVTAAAYDNLFGQTAPASVIGDFNLSIKVAKTQTVRGFFIQDHRGYVRNVHLSVEASRLNSFAAIPTSSGSFEEVSLHLARSVEISGESAVGTLVGDAMGTGAVFDRCATLIKGTIRSTSGAYGCAGGLIGSLGSGASATIRNSVVRVWVGGTLQAGNQNYAGGLVGRNQNATGDAGLTCSNNWYLRSLSSSVSPAGTVNMTYNPNGCYRVSEFRAMTVLPMSPFSIVTKNMSDQLTGVRTFLTPDVNSSDVVSSFAEGTDANMILKNVTFKGLYDEVNISIIPAVSVGAYGTDYLLKPTFIQVTVDDSLEVDASGQVTIRTIPDLNRVSELVKAGNTMRGLTLILPPALTLPDGFIPIGQPSAPFNGTIKGRVTADGAPASVLTFGNINASNAGLVGYSGSEARIENVKAVLPAGKTIAGTNTAGVLTAYLQGTIHNCDVEIGGTVTANTAGGLCGELAGDPAVVRANVTRSKVTLTPNAVITGTTAGGGLIGRVSFCNLIGNVAVLGDNVNIAGTAKGQFIGSLSGADITFTTNFLSTLKGGIYPGAGSAGIGNPSLISYGKISILTSVPYELSTPALGSVFGTVRVSNPQFEITADNQLRTETLGLNRGVTLTFSGVESPAFSLVYDIMVHLIDSGDRYITENGGNDFKDGLSWETAYPKDKLQSAINEIAFGKTVYTAGGTYEILGGVTLKNGCRIWGGYDATNGSRPRSDKDGNGTIEGWEFTNETIVRRIVSGTNVLVMNPDGEVDGMTLTGASSGSGIVTANNAIVRNCNIRDNAGNANIDIGGVNFRGTQVTLQNCWVHKNTNSTFASGINIDGATGKIVNCLISNNEATRWGSSGIGGRGAASTIAVYNSMIARNGSDGVACESGAISLSNCIIWGNGGDQVRGSVTQKNCAIQGNSAALVNLNADNNAVDGPQFKNPSTASENVETGLNTGSLSWALAETSVCINRGDNAFVEIVDDLAGNPRIQNYVVDIGAYESNGWGLSSSTIQVNVVGGNVTSGSRPAAPYQTGDSVMVTADPPAMNKVFKDWTVTGGVIHDLSARTENPFSFVIIGNTDVTLTANYKDNIVKYVTVDGANAKDGSSWDNAADSTQLSAMLTAGDEIRMAEGHYVMTTPLTLTDGKSLIGGWNTETNTRDYSKRPTIRTSGIDGGQTGVFQPQSTSAGSRNIFDGLIMQWESGNAPVIYSNGARFVTLKRIDFLGYQSTEAAPINLQGTGFDVRAEECLFYQTKGKWMGTLHVYTADLSNHITFDRCVIDGGTTQADGLICLRANITLNNCVIKNSVGDGNLFGGYNSSIKFAVRINNCSFVNNNSRPLFGGGTAEISKVHNSVVMGSPVDLTKCAMNHSAWESASATGSNLDLTGKMVNEIFISETDYTPCLGSVLINHAETASVPGRVDLAGNPRVQCGFADIGAYESAEKGTVFFSAVATTRIYNAQPQAPVLTMDANTDPISPVMVYQPAGHTDAGLYSLSASVPSGNPNWSESITQFPDILTINKFPLNTTDSVRMLLGDIGADQYGVTSVEIKKIGENVWTPAVYTAAYTLGTSGSATAEAPRRNAYGDYRVVVTLNETNYLAVFDGHFNLSNPIQSITVDLPAMLVYDNTVKSVTVKSEGRELSQDEYRVSYLNPVSGATEPRNAGTYEVEVSIPGGPSVKTAFTITPLPVTLSDLIISGTRHLYDNTPKTVMVVHQNGLPLIVSDYTVVYALNGTLTENHTAPGSYQITLNFAGGNYTGSVVTAMEIIQTTFCYVSQTGSGDETGLDWENTIPFSRFTTLLSASSSISEIRIAGGEYHLPSTLVPAAGKKVIGSWDPGSNLRPQAAGAKTWEFENATVFTSPSSDNRHLTINANNVVFDGITFRGAGIEAGYAIDIGGSIYMNNATGTQLKNCIVSESWVYNSGAKGGGIAIEGGSAKIENSLVTRNRCKSGGGAGIYISGGSHTLAHSEISGNIGNEQAGTDGAGMKIDGAMVTVTECQFLNNITNAGASGSSGGGLWVGGVSSDVKVFNSVFAGNQCTSNGGGINHRDGHLVIDACTFANNKAGGTSGGINSGDQGGPTGSVYTTISNCLVVCNEGSYGAGIVQRESNVVIVNCTVANNKSTESSYSGALRFYNGAAKIRNTIVWNNTYSIEYEAPLPAGFENLNNNSDNKTVSGNEIKIDASYSFNPQFVNAPAEIGLREDWAVYDWSLSKRSLLVNRGDNAFVVADSDVKGNARITSFAQGGVVDIGAIESPWKLLPETVLAAWNAKIKQGSSVSWSVDKLTVEPSGVEQMLRAGSTVLYGTSDTTTTLPPGIYDVTISTPETDTLYAVRITDPQTLTVVGTSMYVNSGATGNGSGTDWANAAATLADALAMAVDGDTIYVAGGVYPISAPLMVNRKIAILGGFSGTESSPDDRLFTQIGSVKHYIPETILDGQNTSAIGTVTAENVTFEGLVLRHGKADGATAPALHITGANTRLVNCQILSNEGVQRGGVYANKAIYIQNCRFEDNHATGTGAVNGGALWIDQTVGAEVISTLFRNNSSANWAGGIICNNTGDTNGITVRNCIFDGNSAAQYAGAVIAYAANSGSVIEFTNNTFVNNIGTEYAALRIDALSSSVKVDNNIFFNNLDGGTSADLSLSGTNPQYANNAFFGTRTGGSDNGANLDISTQTADALFNVSDSSLCAGSILINRGKNSSASGITADYLGVFRQQRGVVDIGAYESVEPGTAALSAVPTTAIYTGTVQLPLPVFDTLVYSAPLNGSYRLDPVKSSGDNLNVSTIPAEFTITDGLGNWRFAPDSAYLSLSPAVINHITFNYSPNVKFTQLDNYDFYVSSTRTVTSAPVLDSTAFTVTYWKDGIELSGKPTEVGSYKAVAVLKTGLLSALNYSIQSQPMVNEISFEIASGQPAPAPSMITFNYTAPLYIQAEQAPIVTAVIVDGYDYKDYCSFRYAKAGMGDWEETVNTVGAYDVEITFDGSSVPAGVTGYYGVTRLAFGLNVKSSLLEVSTVPFISELTVGDALSQSAFSGGSVSWMKGGVSVDNEPGTWSWIDGSEIFTEAGIHTRNARFTATDLNFAPVTVDLRVLVNPAESGIRYVTADGGSQTDSTGASYRNGRSWLTAADSTQLQAMIQAAGVSEVQVAAGAYRGFTVPNKLITILGGYPENGGEKRDPVANQTFVGSESVTNGRGVNFLANGTFMRTVDGFTIRNFNLSADDVGGAGVFMRGYSTLKNCTVINCQTMVASNQGGGIYVQEGHTNINLLNCRIENCRAVNSASGAYINAPALLEDCTFIGNSPSSESGANYGGALRFDSAAGTSIVRRSQFFKNEASNGGAVYTNATVHFENSLFANNACYSTANGWEGSVINSQAGASTVENCTIVKNYSRTTSNGGVHGAIVNNNNSIRLSNTVMWGNETGNFFVYGTNTIPVMTNCAIDGLTPVSGSHFLLSANNTGDVNSPNFTHLANSVAGTAGYDVANDWTLQLPSLLINRANASILTNTDTDLAGNLRIQNGAPDIGAYESAEQGTLLVTFNHADAVYDGNVHAAPVALVDSDYPADSSIYRFVYEYRNGSGDVVSASDWINADTYRVTVRDELNFWTLPADSAHSVIAPQAARFMVSDNALSFTGLPQRALVTNLNIPPMTEFTVAYGGQPAQTQTGIYPITLRNTNSNYSPFGVDSEIGLLTIYAAPVTFTVNLHDLTYDGSPKTVRVTPSVSMLSDTGYQVAYGTAYSDSVIDAGTVEVFARITDPNFSPLNVWLPCGTMTVKQANPQIALAPLGSHPFNAPDFSVNVTLPEGLTFSAVSGNLSVATATADPANGMVRIHLADIGTAQISVSTSGNTNYTAGSVTEILNVTAATQEISTDTDYLVLKLGETVFFNADASSGLPLTYTAADTTVVRLVDTAVTGVKIGQTQVTVVQAGDSYYLADSAVIQVKVIDNPGLIVILDTEKIYNGFAQSATILTGSSVRYKAEYRASSGEANSSPVNADTYLLTVTDLENSYQISSLFVIAKADLIVQADLQSKFYRTSDPTLTYTLAGVLFAQDRLSGALMRVPGESLGTYAIMQGTLTAGSNYQLRFMGSTLSIDPVEITFTVMNDELLLTAVTPEPIIQTSPYLLVLGKDYKVDSVMEITSRSVFVTLLDTNYLIGNPLSAVVDHRAKIGSMTFYSETPYPDKVTVYLQTPETVEISGNTVGLNPRDRLPIQAAVVPGEEFVQWVVTGGTVDEYKEPQTIFTVGGSAQLRLARVLSGGIYDASIAAVYRLKSAVLTEVSTTLKDHVALQWRADPALSSVWFRVMRADAFKPSLMVPLTGWTQDTVFADYTAKPEQRYLYQIAIAADPDGLSKMNAEGNVLPGWISAQTQVTALIWQGARVDTVRVDLILSDKLPDSGILRFEKKPSIYGKYTAPGKTKETKLVFPVLTQPVNSANPRAVVSVECTKAVPLYNKQVYKEWKNSAERGGTAAFIASSLNQVDSIRIPVWCKAVFKKVKVDDPMALTLFFSAPTIAGSSTDSQVGSDSMMIIRPGASIVLKGMAFGKKLPKVWIEYTDANNGKLKKMNLKVQKNLRFADAKGKTGKSCTNPVTGESEITVTVPAGTWPKGFRPGDKRWKLILSNGSGFAAYPVYSVY